MRDPETTEEWQTAVNMVATILSGSEARYYGLATINVSRCREILERARQKGIIPRLTGVETFSSNK